MSQEPHEILDSPNPLPVLPKLTQGTAWHFTGAAGFLGIIESRQLLASSARVMNDTSELAYGALVIRQEWDELNKSPLHNDVLDLLGPVFDDELAPNVLKRLHIISACKGTDSMYQWLGYAQPDGYAIGLDMAGRWEAVHDGEPGEEEAQAGLDEYGYLSRLHEGWHDVIYTREEQRAATRALLEWMTTINARHALERLDGPAAPRAFLRAQLQTLMALFKDPAFEAEREVRFLVERHFSPGGGKDYLRFRTRGSTIIPALPVARRIDPDADSLRNHYGQQPDGPYELPVTGVEVGPNTGPWAADIAKQVLDSAGIYWIEPQRSLLPRLAT